MAFLSSVKKSFGLITSFFSGSWSELKKVRWPTQKELVSYTIVVLVTVIFVAIYFAIIDLGISAIKNLIF